MATGRVIREISTTSERRTASERRPAPLRLSAEESAKFLRLVSRGALVSRHYGLYQWLSDEVQQFLPHEILVAAWGDFENRQLNVDVTSGMPGVRTAQAVRCRIDDLIYNAHARWAGAGRQPLALGTADFAPLRACGCPLHTALRGMRSAVVHGVRDERSGTESLYLALDRASLGVSAGTQGFRFLVDCLIAQLDVAFRRVGAFPDALDPAARGRWRELSLREQQILGSVCRGESNVGIAAALQISPHTVKNHLQRIFRKIGVSNRTQAAAQYHDAMRAIGGARMASRARPA